MSFPYANYTSTISKPAEPAGQPEGLQVKKPGVLYGEKWEWLLSGRFVLYLCIISLATVSMTVGHPMVAFQKIADKFGDFFGRGRMVQVYPMVEGIGGTKVPCPSFGWFFFAFQRLCDHNHINGCSIIIFSSSLAYDSMICSALSP